MPDPRLTVEDVAVSYRRHPVFEGLSLDIEAARVTAFCGPNGSGKSTALKAMRGLLPLTGGQILLDRRPLGGWGPKALARAVAMLGQTPSAPEDMTVHDLISLGRYPHRRPFAGLGAEDRDAVQRAARSTETADLLDRHLGTLSGGQMQRAWLAMILAQESSTVFLDEPTNHLDVAHALSTLALVRRMATEGGKTVVIVLHDLNMAAAIADRIVLFRGGSIAAQGSVREILREETIGDVFDIACTVLEHPDSGLPLVVPRMPGPPPG
ncbi:MAG: ABC transporter ATP-binding protein [Acidobacteriota bacterium]